MGIHNVLRLKYKDGQPHLTGTWGADTICASSVQIPGPPGTSKEAAGPLSPVARADSEETIGQGPGSADQLPPSLAALPPIPSRAGEERGQEEEEERRRLRRQKHPPSLPLLKALLSPPCISLAGTKDSDSAKSCSPTHLTSLDLPAGSAAPSSRRSFPSVPGAWFGTSDAVGK
ncbi:hypothetical protein NDU88_004736 [Pleurodeles waltl]|uniref:Uncharacterized protein n=1 Tax=Pleurodeles waltl TaxID=8319 RepID=A0AAV7WWQ6_PLEWA|nr:hypothetical protein NDU88_004736 [Pleurodeles waltl]